MAINKIAREDVWAFRAKAAHSGNFNLADTYQTIAGQSAVYPGTGGPGGLMYLALKLNGEAGEYAEHLGKAMRDDGYGVAGDESGDYLDLTDDRRLKLKKELGDQLWYIQQSAKELGFTLSEIMIENLEKLCDRGERDVLSGSGDER